GSGRLGDLVEMRARGKEDQRGGGQDMLVLGTHLFDLMRFLAGDARWCFGQVLQNDKPATRADVRQGGEGAGQIAGDHINAVYGFDRGVIGSFGSKKPVKEPTSRFGLTLYGTRGIIQLTTGSLPAAYFLDDPTWFPGKSKAVWQEIS